MGHAGREASPACGRRPCSDQPADQLRRPAVSGAASRTASIPIRPCSHSGDCDDVNAEAASRTAAIRLPWQARRPGSRSRRASARRDRSSRGRPLAAAGPAECSRAASANEIRPWMIRRRSSAACSSSRLPPRRHRRLAVGTEEIWLTRSLVPSSSRRFWSKALAISSLVMLRSDELLEPESPGPPARGRPRASARLRPGRPRNHPPGPMT